MKKIIVSLIFCLFATVLLAQDPPPPPPSEACPQFTEPVDFCFYTNGSPDQCQKEVCITITPTEYYRQRCPFVPAVTRICFTLDPSVSQVPGSPYCPPGMSINIPPGTDINQWYTTDISVRNIGSNITLATAFTVISTPSSWITGPFPGGSTLVTASGGCDPDNPMEQTNISSTDGRTFTIWTSP
jgi:hypothetical protein